MSNAIPTLPAGPPEPAKVYPKPAAKPPVTHTFDAAPKPTEHREAAASSVSTALSPTALSSRDVAYVDSLMGEIPAQRMQEILLKTGVPIPANLGPNIDTTA